MGKKGMEKATGLTYEQRVAVAKKKQKQQPKPIPTPGPRVHALKPIIEPLEPEIQKMIDAVAAKKLMVDPRGDVYVPNALVVSPSDLEDKT